MNSVTPRPADPAYSLTMGRTVRPLEGKQMFKIEKTNYVVFAVLVFALVAAVIG